MLPGGKTFSIEKTHTVFADDFSHKMLSLFFNLFIWFRQCNGGVEPESDVG